MTLRERLERMVEGLPDDASVTLPVGWLREQLEKTDEPTGADGDRLWTVTELAERYDRAESTVRGWLVAGDLDGFKVKGSWRISADAIQRFESDDEDDGPALGSGGEVDLGSWRKEREGTS